MKRLVLLLVAALPCSSLPAPPRRTACTPPVTHTRSRTPRPATSSSSTPAPPTARSPRPEASPLAASAPARLRVAGRRHSDRQRPHRARGQPGLEQPGRVPHRPRRACPAEHGTLGRYPAGQRRGRQEARLRAQQEQRGPRNGQRLLARQGRADGDPGLDPSPQRRRDRRGPGEVHPGRRGRSSSPAGARTRSTRSMSARTDCSAPSRRSMSPRAERRSASTSTTRATCSSRWPAWRLERRGLVRSRKGRQRLDDHRPDRDRPERRVLARRIEERPLRLRRERRQRLGLDLLGRAATDRSRSSAPSSVQGMTPLDEALSEDGRTSMSSPPAHTASSSSRSAMTERSRTSEAS